ncbi:IclR family transcriptional regulator C-terminal domain-containing protein [Streptomyces sp. Inha503]|uniref:IclR family transcriptional regulator domain-containing protein n=1 Tax=Streptomyces sp. Inha503 TaxID=3383314 RepID=UPI0039A390A2
MATSSAIARGLGLHKSTLLRLLAPLTDNGLVLRDAERARYRLGSHAAYLGGAYLERLDLREVARGALANLAGQTGHTARLSIREADETVLVDAVEGSGPMPVRPRLGARHPLHTGTAGWALLAPLDDAEVARAEKAARLAAASDPASDVAARELRAAVNAARRHGFAVEDGAAGSGMLSVDAPISNHDHAAVAAIGLSGAMAGDDQSVSVSSLGALVREAAREVSRALGARAGRAGVADGGARLETHGPAGHPGGVAAPNGSGRPSRRSPEPTSQHPAKEATHVDRRQVISTQAAPQPVGAYSQAIVAGGFLHTSGLGPHDPVTGRVAGRTIKEQTEQTMRNLAAVLNAHGLEGADLANVLLEIDMMAVLR